MLNLNDDIVIIYLCIFLWFPEALVRTKFTKCCTRAYKGNPFFQVTEMTEKGKVRDTQHRYYNLPLHTDVIQISYFP